MKNKKRKKENIKLVAQKGLNEYLPLPTEKFIKIVVISSSDLCL